MLGNLLQIHEPTKVSDVLETGKELSSQGYGGAIKSQVLYPEAFGSLHMKETPSLANVYEETVKAMAKAKAKTTDSTKLKEMNSFVELADRAMELNIGMRRADLELGLAKGVQQWVSCGPQLPPLCSRVFPQSDMEDVLTRCGAPVDRSPIR